MMKRYFLILIMALTAIGMNAEKLEDRYVSKIVSDGMLFFIKPFELPNQDKGKPAEADITYLIQEDTITLNMSVYHSTILQTDSISFDGSKHCTVTNFETFFIDKKMDSLCHCITASHFSSFPIRTRDLAVQGKTLHHPYDLRKENNYDISEISPPCSENRAVSGFYAVPPGFL